MNPPVSIKRMHPDAILPRRGTEQSVGLDLHAYLISETGRPNSRILPPRTTVNVKTGLIMVAPPGFCLLVTSRSGLAGKSIFVTNGPGVIDPDYRGEICVLMYNGGHETYYIKHEDRIAQVLVAPILVHPYVEVEAFDETERGAKGFGSTGT